MVDEENIRLPEVTEGELREWYTARWVALRLLGKRSPSLARDWHAARKKFPGVRRQALLDLRAERDKSTANR
jgi:hypothetical protein